MKAIADFLFFRFLPRSTDAGLLALRLLAGGSLFLKHGWEKLTTFPEMMAHFPDPIHIGAVPSLMIALIADGICSALVMLGLLTRWAALYAAVNVAVAWGLVHHFAFFAKPQGDHGEVCVFYITANLVLFLAGAGRFSIDGWIQRDRLTAQ